jgi:hypothetical protein
MDDTLLREIRRCATSRSPALPFAPASPGNIESEEAALGFAIPAPLRAVYLRVGNGGFGPGRGGNLIGVRGGYASDFGTLAQAYRQLKRDSESEGKSWQSGLLPFCEWGCNTFSCVDCREGEYPVFLFEDSEVRPQGCTLTLFFERWVGGEDVLACQPLTHQEKEIINPFTRKAARVRRPTME